MAEGKPAFHPRSVGKLGAHPDPPGLLQASPLTPLFSPHRSGTSKDILTGRGSFQCPSFTSYLTSTTQNLLLVHTLRAGLPPPRHPAHSVYIAAVPEWDTRDGPPWEGSVACVALALWSSAFASVRGLEPGAPCWLARAALGIRTRVSISALFQAGRHANVGTAGFANGCGLGSRPKA